LGLVGVFFFNIQHILGCKTEEFCATFLSLDTFNVFIKFTESFVSFKGFFCEHQLLVKQMHMQVK